MTIRLQKATDILHKFLFPKKEAKIDELAGKLTRAAGKMKEAEELINDNMDYILEIEKSMGIARDKRQIKRQVDQIPRKNWYL